MTMIGMPAAPAIPKQAFDALATINPSAREHYVRSDGSFGVAVNGLYVWVAYDSGSRRFVRAGATQGSDGAQLIPAQISP